MTQTIHEIEEGYSRERTELLQDYFREIDDVRTMLEPEGVPHLDKLTPQGYGEILGGQKTAAKDAARGRALERYRKATQDRSEAIEARRARLDARLYHVEDGRLVSDTVGATDEDLRRKLAAAVRTNTRDLAKAVFAEADARGLTSLVDEYFASMDPEGRELYAEYKAAPTREQLETAAEQAEMFVRDPEPETLRYGSPVA